MSRILHKAYGLSIGTDLLLPELSSLSPDAVDDVDVEIQKMALGGSRVLWGVAADGTFSLGLQNLLVAQIPGVTTFGVRGVADSF